MVVSALYLVLHKTGRGAKRKALQGGNLMVDLLLMVGFFFPTSVFLRAITTSNLYCNSVQGPEYASSFKNTQ